MRLWTLHPKYLDRQGLLAVWREGLLAQSVLRGNTRGYKNHPQLNRFKNHLDPLQAIAFYLNVVYEEANMRGYRFDATKINLEKIPQNIPTTFGQMEFELRHLLAKLKKRSKHDYENLIEIDDIEPHPLFQITHGEIEDWEYVDKR